MSAPAGWRDDAPTDLVRLSVARGLVAMKDTGRWRELGLLTGTRDKIENHPRLLRSLYWNDPDYSSQVYDVLDSVLGFTDSRSAGLLERFSNLGSVSDFLDLPEWLERCEPDLYSKVCIFDDQANLPDGTVLDRGEATAARLQVAEMRRQIERIRRDFDNDPESLVGQSKAMTPSR